MSTKSFLTVGSPPVNRIFVTPCLTKSFAKRMTSSVVSSFSFCVNFTPSAGMQYWPTATRKTFRHSLVRNLHRKLHLSVSEILRYVCFLWKVSVSGSRFSARTWFSRWKQNTYVPPFLNFAARTHFEFLGVQTRESVFLAPGKLRELPQDQRALHGFPRRDRNTTANCVKVSRLFTCNNFFGCCAHLELKTDAVMRCGATFSLIAPDKCEVWPFSTDSKNCLRILLFNKFGVCANRIWFAAVGLLAKVFQWQHLRGCSGGNCVSDVSWRHRNTINSFCIIFKFSKYCQF